MPLSVPCAVVGWREHMPPSKGTRVTTNMNFVRRSSSPLSSGRLYKTPVRQRRLSHAHKSRRSHEKIGPPLSGPKSHWMYCIAAGDDDGAVRRKHLIVKRTVMSVTVFPSQCRFDELPAREGFAMMAWHKLTNPTDVEAEFRKKSRILIDESLGIEVAVAKKRLQRRIRWRGRSCRS